MIYLKLILMALFWSGAFICGRLVVGRIEPFSVAALRFVLAAALLGLTFVVGRRRMPHLSGRQLIGVILLGFFGIFLYNALFFTGLQTVSAGKAALIIALNPALVTIGAVLLGERLTVNKALGASVSLLGALFVIGGGNWASLFSGAIGFGELCLIGCVFSWAIYSLLGKRLLAKLSASATVLLSMSAGALMLLIPAVAAEGLLVRIGEFDAVVWLAILFMVTLSSVLGFVWYYQGINEIGATRTANFINLMPFSAALLGYFLLDETLGLAQIFGGVLILAGVWLVNHGGRPRRIPE